MPAIVEPRGPTAHPENYVDGYVLAHTNTEAGIRTRLRTRTDGGRVVAPYGGALSDYHLHPPKGRESVPHAVCVPRDGSGADRHYLAYEMDLLAVHEEFEGQHAAGRPVDFRGLRPID